MKIDLDRATFRRLVQLYLLSIILLILAVAYETLGRRYAAFSAEFDLLQTQHFGELSDPHLHVVLAVAIFAFVTHLIASVALLWFKPWARWMFWASVLLSIPFGLVPAFEVYWTGFWTGWTTFLGSALFGMILLLAYSREHGVIWFASNLKETA